MKWCCFALAILAVIMLALSGCFLVTKSEIKAEDIPLREGTRYETYANDAGRNPNVSVSFNLKGPWDFSKGPTDIVVKSVIVKKRKAAASNKFPKATLAEEVLGSSLSSEFTIYNFTSINEQALFLYGQSLSPKIPEFKPRVYDQPERLLKFPLRVGTHWKDTFRGVEEEPLTTVTADKKVISQGTVVLPAGTFRGCFLIQIKRATRMPTSSKEPKTKQIIYVWWAPGVGPVAWIVGEPDGSKEVFSQAAQFFRLKSYEVKE